MAFPFYKQRDIMDCGPSCLKMIIEHYGRTCSIQKLRTLCFTDKRGSTLLALSDAAEKIGFRTLGLKLSVGQLSEVQLPCILHWRQNHYVVLYAIKDDKFFLADPALGLIRFSKQEFIENWHSRKELHDGISLILAPTPLFSQWEEEYTESVKWSSILKYYVTYRQLFYQLILALSVGTLLQLVIPFFTQIIVDVGITTKNLSFITLVLIAQIVFFLGNMSVNFLRSWILLNISTRINISILTDFLIKMMKLPLNYFESKTTGDFLQRITDQQKIESFLTGTSLNTFFSFISLIVYTIVLLYYNLSIFLISIFSSLLYVGWILLFLRQRKQLNYRQFSISSANQSAIVELINGMQEIKLNNFEKRKRWNWEIIQAKLYKFKVKNLTLSQYQQSGSGFINQSKNILIMFLSVKAVIEGNMTLGEMMAIQFITVQISNPFDQFVSFIQAYQDAKISLERLNEVYQMDEEEPASGFFIQDMPSNKNIEIKDLTFSYPGPDSYPVLSEINLSIPSGKTTAIVGVSGSGKTTLIKLLLRYYSLQAGQIKIGKVRLGSISHRTWRSNCGVVMQDGFIFSDTIANNIVLEDENIDYNRLEEALNISNINDFINELPLGIQTKIGLGGKGISQGQKQRLLIARAVYKNPEFLFFDEATNALDSKNERTILNNMADFTKGKTVIVVAHRLSTVQHAENIVVLDKGKIIEQGTHQELTTLKGHYFELVRNQLELGI